MKMGNTRRAAVRERAKEGDGRVIAQLGVRRWDCGWVGQRTVRLVSRNGLSGRNRGDVNVVGGVMLLAFGGCLAKLVRFVFGAGVEASVEASVSSADRADMLRSYWS